MRRAERAYALLLHAYPESFRREFAREMMLVFRDQRRTEHRSGVRFWVELIMDVVRSAAVERVEALRTWWDTHIHIEEGTMKPMAIVAGLIGALEAVNASVELWAGGVKNGDGFSLAGGMLGVLAGLLLLAAGIVLVRSSTVRSLAWARGAAISCLSLFVFIAVVTPRLSLLATILGIGIPIVLLFFLHRAGGRGRAQPMVA